MSKVWHDLLHDQRGEIAEAVVTIPIVLMVLIAMFNLALVGYASVAAQNAANYGARRGSVAQSDPVGVAMAATQTALGNTMVGDYGVGVSGGGGPGSSVSVAVRWRIPNYFAGLGQLFPGLPSGPFTGESVAVFRQEGW